MANACIWIESTCQIIMSKCVQVKHAVVAQDKLGADLITLMGFDSGGLPGEADMGVFVQMALVLLQHFPHRFK